MVFYIPITPSLESMIEKEFTKEEIEEKIKESDEIEPFEKALLKMSMDTDDERVLFKTKFIPLLESFQFTFLVGKESFPYGILKDIDALTDNELKVLSYARATEKGNIRYIDFGDLIGLLKKYD